MPPKKSSPLPPPSDADEIERNIMAEVQSLGIEDEDFEDGEDEEDISVVELLEQLQESLRLAYLTNVDEVAPVAPPSGAPEAEALNRCSLAVAALVAPGVSHLPWRDAWLEHLLDAYRVTDALLQHDDLEAELMGAIRRIRVEIDGIAPTIREILSQPGIDDPPLAQIEGWDAAALADLLPDGGTAEGALAVRRQALAWLRENFADYPEDKAREAAAGITAFDVADIHASDEEALLRMIVVKPGERADGEVAFFCLKSNRQETDCVGEAVLMNGNPRTWEPPDRMKAVSLALDALAGFAFDDVTVAFRPLFASFANPFGPISVGAAESPTDRRAARAARIRSSKRRH